MKHLFIFLTVAFSELPIQCYNYAVVVHLLLTIAKYIKMQAIQLWKTKRNKNKSFNTSSLLFMTHKNMHPVFQIIFSHGYYLI